LEGTSGSVLPCPRLPNQQQYWLLLLCQLSWYMRINVAACPELSDLWDTAFQVSPYAHVSDRRYWSDVRVCCRVPTLCTGVTANRDVFFVKSSVILDWCEL
jgi:hypothetical protein